MTQTWLKTKLRELKTKLPAAYKEHPRWFLGGAVILVLLLWLVWPNSLSNSAAVFFEAKRGDFLISVVEGGTLEAVNEVIVRSEVEGTARIIHIVPEGSYVKKGDLLVELDSSQAQDQVNQQNIAYEKARFALIQAKEQLTIQKSAVDSEVRAAELKAEFAKTDLKKYIEGESLQLKRNLEIETKNVEENLALAKERLDWSEKLHAQGFETKSNLDKDRLAVSQYILRLEQAKNALQMFETFDFPKQKRQQESNVDQADKELERVKLQGERKLAQFEADVTTQQSTTELSRKKLERDQANLNGCKIFAPQDGLVVYAISGNRFSSESLIEGGATVRNRQELIKLPDISEMKLMIKIHESHINMIKPGLPAFVVLDSMPDQRFRGTVKKVALLPDAQSRWGNPNLKVYATEIVLTDTLPNVKPGVSARAEIVVHNLQNVLTVPLQAVTTQQGRQVVYVAGRGGPKAVSVEVGRYNTKLIEVVKGLEEGDRVLLAPPLDSEEKDLGGSILTKEEAATLPAPPPSPAKPTAAPSANPPSPAPLAPPPLAAPTAQTENPPAAPGGRAGSGQFNREEMMKQALKQFDKNGDGQLDDEERAAMRAYYQERFGSQGGDPGGQRRRRGDSPPTDGTGAGEPKEGNSERP